MGLRSEISRAAESLAEAGIDSAHVDAELLAAHVAGVDRGRLTFIDTPEGFSARYRELIDGRVRRVTSGRTTSRITRIKINSPGPMPRISMDGPIAGRAAIGVRLA